MSFADFVPRTLMVFGRVFCRTRLVGLRGYCADDYLVWFAWVGKLYPDSKIHDDLPS